MKIPLLLNLAIYHPFLQGKEGKTAMTQQITCTSIIPYSYQYDKLFLAVELLGQGYKPLQVQ